MVERGIRAIGSLCIGAIGILVLPALSGGALPFLGTGPGHALTGRSPTPDRTVGSRPVVLAERSLVAGGPGVGAGSPLGSVAPTGRGGASLAYDARDGYVVLFGGIRGSSDFSDTWTFSAGVWKELHPTTHPMARYDASMVFDAADGYVVLFGGFSTRLNHAFASTWAFAGGNWTRLNPALSPLARYDAGIVNDAKDGYVLMYGGLGTRYHSILLDTWKFSGGNWSRVASTGGPPVYAGEQLTYDARDQYVLLFGGDLSPGLPSNQTWSFTGGVWTNRTGAVTPPARDGSGLAYDSAQKVTVLFGGFDGVTYRNDTWSYAAGVWSPLAPTVTPGPFSWLAMVNNPHAGKLVLFGYPAPGASSSAPTWFFQHGTWRQA